MFGGANKAFERAERKKNKRASATSWSVSVEDPFDEDEECDSSGFRMKREQVIMSVCVSVWALE